MCGICGKLNFDRDKAISRELINSMADTITHRGPDDDGYYVEGAVGFGFRRLSIIDLSGGHQPLANEDDTVWIVFNGEIYNYQELRELLLSKGHTFKTKTDTEVIVHLYEEFGERCVEKLRGMFAFAIWDKSNEKLFIARDRVGIKPLYYHVSPRALTFGSEIKAILADPDVKAEVDPAMIDRYLTYYFVPGAETMMRGIRKLQPGCYLVASKGQVKITQYWDLKFSSSPRTESDAEGELLSLLDEAVRMHMIADVPVGFLLSGGVDSTAMLGMAVGKTQWPLSSYTLGFTAPGIADERPYARLAAARYGSEHHEISMTATEFVDFLPKFAWYMEEPCCEPQAIALYYVTQLAAKYVKVLISGEGGDEAFAGYPIYRNLLWLERIKRALGPLNAPASFAMGQVNRLWHSHRLGKYGPLLTQPFSSYYYSRTSSPAAFFNRSTRELYTPGFLSSVDRAFSTGTAMEMMNRQLDRGLVNAMLYVDTKMSLPDDLLLKADKMTMANSVELRVPFLDHKFLEFAASLPENFKVHGITTKYLAKKALRRRVPREILERKKVGFPVPYESWMRNELKDWVRDLLLGTRAVGRGYFNRQCIEHLLDEDNKHHSYPKEVLSLVSLELWHRTFIDQGSGVSMDSLAGAAALQR